MEGSNAVVLHSKGQVGMGGLEMDTTNKHLLILQIDFNSLMLTHTPTFLVFHLGLGDILVLYILDLFLLLSFTIMLHIRGPQGEVIPEQLHYKGGVLVALLTQRV